MLGGGGGRALSTNIETRALFAPERERVAIIKRFKVRRFEKIIRVLYLFF